MNLTGNRELVYTSIPSVKSFINNLPDGNSEKGKIISRWNKAESFTPKNEGFIIPSQVNYVAKGGYPLPKGSTVKGSYTVAVNHLNTGYLWDSVRVQGGAYGGFSRFARASGRFVYLSYRDPNCFQTLARYDEAADVLSKANLSSEELLQSIIGTVGDLDSPLSADQKGYLSMIQYLARENAADRQEWRTSILNANNEDIREFGAMLQGLRDKGNVVVFGTESAIADANSKLPEHQKLHVEQAFASSAKKS